jgi:hypothetical protein
LTVRHCGDEAVRAVPGDAGGGSRMFAWLLGMAAVAVVVWFVLDARFGRDA